MQYFKLVVNSTLLLTTPSLLVYPQSTAPRIAFESQTIEEGVHSNAPASLYDKIVHLLDKIESGELEKKCSADELKRLEYFLAFLAKKGALPDNSAESLSLDDDINALLNEQDSFDDFTFPSSNTNAYEYMIAPYLLSGQYKIVLCKSWISKKWSHVRHFAKKHKKELLIGAAVVVGAAAVVAVVAVASSAAAGAAVASAASAAGAAASSDSDKKAHKEEPSVSSILEEINPLMVATQEAPALTSAIDHHASAFKDQIIRGEFFQSQSGDSYHQQLPLHESARALGSLFTHDSFSNLQNQIAYHPGLAQEAQHLGSKYDFSAQNATVGHTEIDRNFSTDYSYLYARPGQEVDFNALSYQVRGEQALAHGYYNQAVQDFGKAIETNPTNPIPYLERGVAHFGMGQYDRSIEDYHRFASEAQKSNPLSVPEFSLGFAKGLPKGIYDSGSGLFFLVSDLVTHPINTGKQMWDALSLLSSLVRSEEWATLSEALVPEVYQLVKEWDALSSEQKGKLAGHAFGKHGSDILIPGAVAKCVTKGVKGAQELHQVYKGLQTAEQTLLLESVAGLETGAKIAEVLETNQKMVTLGDELGFSVHEMTQLKQTGQLETTVQNRLEHLSLPMQESMALHKRAKIALKPYAKQPMPESKVRELIHETGIPTFPRPVGIPSDFLVMISEKGAGIEYVHPTNTHIRVRVMPGKPHSPNPCQQKPYVIQKTDSGALDKMGKHVSSDAPEAHIPVEEFIYRSHIDGN